MKKNYMEKGKQYFENGEEKKALKEFTNVYIYDGLEAFENEDEKYLELFKKKVLENPNKPKKLKAGFWEILYYKDFDTLKRLFDIYSIDATYNGYNVFYYPMTIEKMKFFIERGLNPNSDCGGGFPAIVYQCGSKDCINFLKKYNADLDLAMKYCKENDEINKICKLMECGVELGDYHFNVEYWLENGQNIDIIYIYKLAKIEIEKGLEITRKMKESLTKMGKTFEFYRADFNKEYVDEYSDALDGLYKLFGVKPVQKRVGNNLQRKICVKSRTWQQQFEDLWKMLVPGSGPAISIQGELIRVTGKVSREILDNGGVNWDVDYRKMVNEIPKYIAQGVDTNNKEIIDLVKQVSVNSKEETLNQLCRLIVEWVLANPNQIELKNVKYNR